MSAPFVDILTPLRQAVVNNAAIATELATYLDGPSVHTRVPIPDAADAFPLVIIGPIAVRDDEDGLTTYRPFFQLDVKVYGEQPTHYRVVETLAECIYGLFHRQRDAIVVPDYNVVDIRCTGPIETPVSDEKLLGRRVSMTIRLFASP